MTTHRLILSDTQNNYPVHPEAKGSRIIRVLVVHWTGHWAPTDHPEHCLVVAVGDELEFALESKRHPGASVWLFPKTRALLLGPDEESPGSWERVDVASGSKVLRVNPALVQDSREQRYDVRLSALGQWPRPIVGQGQAGSLTATKP